MESRIQALEDANDQNARLIEEQRAAVTSFIQEQVDRVRIVV